MAKEIPKLRILPVESLVLHERYDDQRAPRLIERLKQSGVLINPPIVSPMPDGTERYMVLDGANRTTAFASMGLPHVVAQVVQPDDKRLELKAWNHVLRRLDPNEFLDRLHSIPDLEFKPTDADHDPDMFWDETTLAWIQTKDGSSFTVSCTDCELLTRVANLNAIVDCYTDYAKIDRAKIQELEKLNHLYEDMSVIVAFPPFGIIEVFGLCSGGHRLPAGITRFAISPRALRVNYPLDELARDITIDQKNDSLSNWIKERLTRKGIRHYSEATVLFDE
ncbi:MAG: hypothetical protein FVQ83_10175 [Chloroflexi bacterium]|nr:hypothetical protein [Chloroflexota bacterium]